MGRKALDADALDIETTIARLTSGGVSPAEEAAAFDELIRGKGLGVREVARRVNKHPSYVSRRLRVFADADLGAAVRSGAVAISTAERILSVRAPQDRAALVQRALAGQLDQKTVRALIRQRRQAAATPEATRETAPPSPASTKGNTSQPPTSNPPVERATTVAIRAIENLLRSSERLSADEKRQLLDLSDQLYAFAKRRGPIW
ncbi:MAG: hypothetical protein NZ518_02075 [Dehalococcoidia bacterium]|nr:hypothetical protein [Dehalococcoidia bacterium]